MMKLLEDIYLKIDLGEILQNLKPKLKGDHFELICPNCNERRAYIYKNGKYIICNRSNNCNYKKSLFDYVKETQHLSNNWEVIKELAKIAGINIPKSNSFSETKFQEMKEKEDILEDALSYFKKQLFEIDGKEVLGYLIHRGYTNDEIKCMDLGYYPSQEDVKKYLERNYSTNTLNIVNSILFTKNFGITHKLVIPFRNHNGILEGFILRSILQENDLKNYNEQKYKFNFGLKPSLNFFNIDNNLREDTLIIVEGYLDSLIATQRGIKGVVSTGGDSPRKDQLDNAVKYGTKRFILALDSDVAGIKGTEKALDMINEAGGKGYVITLPENIKDPDELIKAKGIDAFQTLIHNAEDGFKWKAKRLFSKHSKQDKQSLSDLEKDKLIDEAIEHGETIKDPLDSKNFIDTISEMLDIPVELLEPKFKDYYEKKGKEKQKKAYESMLSNAQRLYEDGEIDSIGEYLSKELPSIRAKGVYRIIQPYTLGMLTMDINNAEEGLKTGYVELDKKIIIQQEAITIIAGRPSHGKTTFLLNIFLNMIQNYPEKIFFFFSYEESKKQLALKCINILGNAELDQYHNLKHLKDYIKTKNSKQVKNDEIKKIDEAISKYNKLTTDGRLWIIDEHYYINDLTDTIKDLKDKYPNIGAIFIDYIQKIKSKDNSPTRQVVLQKISEAILETAKITHLPIILGAQFTRSAKSESEENVVRLDNLRECGDIEQDANLVLGLYNEAMHKAQSDEVEFKGKENDLKITILKNRNGEGVATNITLKFIKPTSKIIGMGNDK